MGTPVASRARLRSITFVAGLALLAPALAIAAGDAEHRPWSRAPPGPYAILAATPENFTASDGTHVSYAVHMPDVPAGTRVPVILTAGPYFALEEEPVHVPSTKRLSGFLIENFVPHGYAVVAASVRGTGWSGGCQEFLSTREGRDLDELVTFLASREWSTGAVAMIGKSYDGSTPWNVARFGNPALRTIVPIAGITSAVEQHTFDGVSSPTAAIYHALVYYPYGFGVGGVGGTIPVENPGRSPLDRAANAACPEVAESVAAGSWTFATGDASTAPALTDYWRERDWRAGVIERYDGSVFVVHGLEDRNVWPHQVVPFFDELPQEKKLWLGQWEHEYPDEGARTNRDDFATTLLQWFERHLKGRDVDTGPIAEVADETTDQWHSYATWPPGPETRLAFRSDGALVPGNGERFSTIVTPGVAHACGDPTIRLPFGLTIERPGYVYFETTLAESVRAAGQFEVEADIGVLTAGMMRATLCLDGTYPTLYAATGFLFADGEDELTPYAPGLPLTVRAVFEPIERTLPPGARVGVALSFGSSAPAWLGSEGAVVLRGGALVLPHA